MHGPGVDEGDAWSRTVPQDAVEGSGGGTRPARAYGDHPHDLGADLPFTHSHDQRRGEVPPLEKDIATTNIPFL